MADSKATLKYLIGINSDICNNVFYFDEETIFYPCGCYCVFFNTQQKNMRLLIASEKGTEITAMAICPSRNYSAVALNSEKPSINVLDLLTLQKSKTLVCRELHSCKIVSLSFSSNSQYIVALCDDPSRTLLYWSWKRSKLLRSTKVVVSLVPETLYHVSFNPQTHFNVYIFGNRFLKLFHFGGNKYKQFNFPKIVPQDFKCYCWDANERLLVGTGSGRVLFIEDTDLKLDFNVFQHSTICNESVISYGITAVASYSKGFITACGTKYVQFFERVEDKDNYKFVRNVWFPSNVLENSDLCDQIIKWMVVNPSEDVLVISTNMKQMYSTQVYPPETEHTIKTGVFGVLVQPFHYKAITGCCVCSWKPLIATSSLDGSIKVWNYETFTLELSKDFSEEVYSISMHPMGLFLLAGFSDKLRFMYILRDDFKQFKEFNICMCTHCNFSRGGHLFVAVNNSFIHVYSSTTFKRVANLKGHNGKVQATIWYMDDNNLISCDSDGVVCDWEIKTGNQIGRSVCKSCAYNDVAMNYENKKVYAVGSDYTMKEIYESNIIRTLQSGDVRFTSVAMSWSNTMIFVGSNDGHIKGIECPPTLNGNCFDYPCHSLETTHVIFTSDDQYLISISKDYSVAIWAVNNAENQNAKHKQGTGWSKNVLIPMEELWGKKCEISKLKTRVEELIKKNEYELHLRDTNYNNTIKEISENYNQVIEDLKTKNRILENDKVKEKSRHDEKMAEIINNHCTKIDFFNCAIDEKFMVESEIVKHLQDKIMKLPEEQEQEIQKLEEMQESFEIRLTDKYEKKIEDLMKEIDQCEENGLVLQKEHDEIEKFMDEDAEIEYLSTKAAYEKLLYVERCTNSKMKDENNILKKKLLTFPKDIKKNEDECQKQMMEYKRLNFIKSNLEEAREILQGELFECQGFTDEDKRFCKLKLMNHDVSKLKCELKLKKIIELRQIAEAKETEVNKKKKQMASMRNELESFTRQFFTMDYNIAETKFKLAATFQELGDVRSKLQQKIDLWDRFCSDLINLISLQDPHRLKNCLKSLYEKYIGKNGDKIVTSDPNLLIEWGRQRNHFEYTIHKLKHNLKCESNYSNQQNHHMLKKCNKLGGELQLKRNTMRRQLLS